MPGTGAATIIWNGFRHSSLYLLSHPAPSRVGQASSASCVWRRFYFYFHYCHSLARNRGIYISWPVGRASAALKEPFRSDEPTESGSPPFVQRFGTSSTETTARRRACTQHFYSTIFSWKRSIYLLSRFRVVCPRRIIYTRVKLSRVYVKYARAYRTYWINQPLVSLTYKVQFSTKTGRGVCYRTSEPSV